MINNSYLLGLFSLQTGIGSSGTSALASPPRPRTTPTPPWDAKAVVPQADALLRAALGGRRIIDEAAARLDVPGASRDYQRLFTLYQGLETLTALANRAGVKGLSATEQALVARRFESGLAELGQWLPGAGFDRLNVTQGISTSSTKTTAGVARDSARSITAPIHSGSPDAPVAAFMGDVRFSIDIGRIAGDVRVDIDLADMGSETRTLGSVLAFINQKLEDAGVQTRLGREQIKAEPRTVQAGGRTITLPAGLDQWALAVRGSVGESVSFGAPDTADAVYVTQKNGAGTTQLLKFQDAGAIPDAIARPGDTYFVDGRSVQETLPANVTAVRETLGVPDGGLWVLADVSTGSANQPIKGAQDVALMRFDSAGRLMFTRTLGAADEASGLAMALGPEGQVAIAGSVKGALEPGRAGTDARLTDSFVTVFDATGQELWSHREGARAEDEATAISFDSSGRLIVAGRTRSAMPETGQAVQGGWDSYVRIIETSRAHAFAPITARVVETVQFGTTGDDGVSAIALSGDTLIVAGIEAGEGVLRSYDLSGGAPVLAQSRSLGTLGGSIAGVFIEDGRVVLAGTSSNAALSADAITSDHSGGRDAFVASFDISLGDGRLGYYGGEGDDTIADVKVLGGKVWITGVQNRDPLAKDDAPSRAYLHRIDAASGALDWTRDWSGEGAQAVPMSLAVAAGGASVLDRLGLPQGTIPQSDSKRLVDATALRAGDRFYVASPTGRPVAVTIEARDTLQTLARKIEQASQNKLQVTVVSEGGHVTGKDGETPVTAGGFQRLMIAPRSGREGAMLMAGETGRDALAALGLTPGVIAPSTAGQKDARKTYGLQLLSSLNLNSPDAIKAAGQALQQAMSVVRTAYRDLNSALNPSNPAISGKAPAYLTGQIANYQAALARLTGGF